MTRIPDTIHWRRPLLAAAVLAICWGRPVEVDAQASRVRFDHLTLEQGLSQSTVTCVFQDSRGYMWFGTQDGLNRFNGYQVDVFKHDAEDRSGVAAPQEYPAISEDAAGDLWIGTEGGGIARWDHHSGRFTSYALAEASVDGHATSVSSLQHDPSGMLWVGTFDAGLHRFDPATGTTRSYRFDAAVTTSLSNDHIGALHLDDPTGVLWVGTDRGLNRFDDSADSFVRYSGEQPGADDAGGDKVRSILQDRAGIVWFGTVDSGLVRLDPITGATTRFVNDPADSSSPVGNRIYAILQDRQGQLWVGTDGGLSLLDSATGSFARYEHVAADPSSLSQSDVRSLYQDEGGVMWVGTGGKGLSKWNPVTASFQHYKTESTPGRVGLSNDTISSFSEDAHGNLWIGTVGGGLNRLDRASGTYTVFAAEPENPDSLSDDRVMALTHDRDGALWIATVRGGLNRYDPVSKTFRAYKNEPGDPTSLGSNGVMSLFVDREATLWVGTYGGGLNRFDAESETFTRFLHDPNDSTSLSDDRVTSIAEDAGGKLWIGTVRGGLNRYDPGTGTFVRYEHDPDARTSLSSNFVMSLHAADRILWVGTLDAGLNRLDIGDSTLSSRPTFRRYSERDGLPNDAIYGIEAGVGDALWLSTNRGLSRFEPGTDSFTNYDVSHGLQSNEFNGGAHYRSPSGELFFGGFNGFNAFRPQRTRTNRHAAPVVLTSFSKFNKPVVLEQEPSELETIELSYRDYVFSFEVALLDYTAPHENRYPYILEGFSDEWIDLGTRRNVTFTNLDPANYVLRVRAANNDGMWSDQEVVLPFSISPPLWLTWWAYGLYGLLVVGAGAQVVHVQNQKLKRRERYSRQLEQQVEERTAQLGEQNVRLEQRGVEMAEINGFLQQEVSEHERTGRALRASEQRYLDLYDHAPDMFATVDAATGIVVQCNLTLTSSLSCSREEIVGLHINELHHSDCGAGLDAAFEQIRASGEVHDVELRLMPRDGEEIHVSLNMSATHNTGDTDMHCRLVWRDITERNRLEEELRHAGQLNAIGQLAGGIAHEFNNLLMGIHGFTDLLTMSVTEPEPLADLEKIRECATRATGLTGQLLTFSRRQPVRPIIVDLNECVRRASELLDPIIGEVIELELNCAPEVGVVSADPGQLEQVLLNLAINARDAMPQGGRLTIETEVDTLEETGEVEAGRYARLSVVDTGEGIDEETLGHVFEPFFTTKDQGDGVGLGLAMVYGAIKQHNGHIQMSSRVEEGTSVTIHLPLLDEAA